MCADMGDRGIPILELGLIRGPDGCLPLLHDLGQLLNGGRPCGFREGREGFRIVTGEVGGILPIEFIERVFVPEQQVIGQFTDGMAAVGGLPHGLLGAEAFERLLYGDEPVLMIPGGLELFEQDGSKGCRGLVLAIDPGSDPDSSHERKDEQVFFHMCSLISNINKSGIHDRIAGS